MHGKIRRLGREAAARNALTRSQIRALIFHKRITTTLAKAKSLKRNIAKLVTRSKVDTMHNRRWMFAKLQDKRAVQEIFETIGPRILKRPGGYTRVIELQERIKGNGAPQAMIELVEFNTLYSRKKKLVKTRRSRGRKRTTTSTLPPQAAQKQQAEVSS